MIDYIISDEYEDSIKKTLWTNNLLSVWKENQWCKKQPIYIYWGGMPSVYIKNPKNIYIGDNFFIGKDFLLGVFSDNGKIEIGDNVGCQQRVRISAVHSVQIGNNVLMGSDIFITDNNHGTDAGDPLPYGRQPLSFKEVKIGDDCWIGDKVVILPGVKCSPCQGHF